jgi:hypothetical protein
MGGCVVMTLFAAVGVYLVRGDAQLSFYLALAAHAQILIGMTALAAQFVKRSLQVGPKGISIEDNAIQSGDTVTMEKQQ